MKKIKQILLILLLVVVVLIFWYYCYYSNEKNIENNPIYDEINFNGYNEKIFNNYDENNLTFLKTEKFKNITLKNINNHLINIFPEIKSEKIKFYLSSCDNSYFFENIQNLKIKNLYIITEPCLKEGEYIEYDISLKDWENLAKWSWYLITIESLGQKMNINEAKALSKITSRNVSLGIDLDSLSQEIIDILVNSETVYIWGPDPIFKK